MLLPPELPTSKRFKPSSEPSPVLKDDEDVMAKATVPAINDDGHKIEESEVINERLEPGICKKDEIVDDNTVVRVRGLPWQSSDQDVAKFFEGLDIVKGGVALCLSPQGRRNGEALVRFANQEHRDMALKRHKNHIGQRYIEVYRANGEDFVNVAGGNNNEAQQFLSRGGQVIVRMRGLPYDCTAQQVIDFFSGSGAAGETNSSSCDVMHGEEGVLFVRKADGRATGDAFVLFESEDMASKALLKHREVIGSRYIELFRCSTAEVQQIMNRSTIDSRQPQYDQQQQQQPLLNGNFSPLSLMPHSQQLQQMMHHAQHPQGSRKDSIRLRGLPYEAQVEQILEFLGTNAKNIVFQGIHMVYNAQGQPSGEAFIQMDSEASAAMAAAQRHHKYMTCINGQTQVKKQRYIEVFQCSIDDMNLVLTGGVVPAPAALPRQLLSPGGTGGLLPAAYGSYAPHPYMQSHHHGQVLPNSVTAAAAAALSNPAASQHHRVPASYYPHPMLYWPYPSPPVSPTTYYAHSGPTMMGRLDCNS